MPKGNQYLARMGEEAAAGWLKEKGYKILSRNYKTRLGEIDIVAREKDTFCFIEVKARSSDRFGLPQEALSEFKKRQISKTALLYLKENKLMDRRARCDVVSIVYNQEGIANIDIIRDAFMLSEEFIY